MLRRLHCSLNLLIFWLLKTESITFQFLLSSENDGGQIWSVHCGSKAHCVRHFWRQPQKHQCYWTRNSRFASRSCSCRRSGRQNRPCGFRWDFQIWNNTIFNWRFFPGNVVSSSKEGIYLTRHIGLRVGVPQSVGALTVNRLCGSGFQVIWKYFYLERKTNKTIDFSYPFTTVLAAISSSSDVYFWIY